jgi:hypothetical protein
MRAAIARLLSKQLFVILIKGCSRHLSTKTLLILPLDHTRLALSREPLSKTKSTLWLTLSSVERKRVRLTNMDGRLGYALSIAIIPKRYASSMTTGFRFRRWE